MWTQELMNERLISTIFHLAGKSNAINFVVEYGSTYTVSKTWEQKDAFWADFDILFVEFSAATTCLYS